MFMLFFAIQLYKCLKYLDFCKETVINVTAYNVVVVSQILEQFPFFTGQMDGQEEQHCKA